MKKICDSPATCFIVGALVGFLIGLGLGHKTNKEIIVRIPTHVEKSVIDTLYLTRDSLIYCTQYLDSIKHDTIQKVYNLNDSSTLELFYKLVSE